MKPPPECRKCKHVAILADAGIFKSIPYFYCRGCKNEVDLWGYPIIPRQTAPLDELNEYLSEEVSKLPDEEVELELDLEGYPYSPFSYYGYLPPIPKSST